MYKTTCKEKEKERKERTDAKRRADANRDWKRSDPNSAYKEKERWREKGDRAHHYWLEICAAWHYIHSFFALHSFIHCTCAVLKRAA